MKIIIIILSMIFIFGCEQWKTSPVKESTGKVICSDVCKGQVWRWSTDDPFVKNKHVDYLILDVKGKYVKYIDLKYANKDSDYSSSSSKEWFKIGVVLMESK